MMVLRLATGCPKRKLHLRPLVLRSYNTLESHIVMGTSPVRAAWLRLFVLLVSLAALLARADTGPAPSTEAYRLQAGDILEISVWKETDLQRDALVRPDGSFSFPLAGDIDARGKTVDNVRAILVERLEKFVPSPTVS